MAQSDSSFLSKAYKRAGDLRCGAPTRDSIHLVT